MPRVCWEGPLVCFKRICDINSRCTDFLRSTSTRTANVSVGTVKKSIAAMASRWFLRNVSQRFTESGSLGARRCPPIRLGVELR